MRADVRRRSTSTARRWTRAGDARLEWSGAWLARSAGRPLGRSTKRPPTVLVGYARSPRLAVAGGARHASAAPTGATVRDASSQGGRSMAQRGASRSALLRDAGVACVTLKGPAFARQRYWATRVCAPSATSTCSFARRDLAARARGARGGGHCSAPPTTRTGTWSAGTTTLRFIGRAEPPAMTVEMHWDFVRPGLSRLPGARRYSAAIRSPSRAGCDAAGPSACRGRL